jgi:hypothetical protein
MPDVVTPASVSEGFARAVQAAGRGQAKFVKPLVNPAETEGSAPPVYTQFTGRNLKFILIQF